MKRQTMIVAALTMLAWAMPAAAQKDRLVDPSKPEVIAEILREEGYKAVVAKRDNGEPYIQSAANGSNFTIEFYGCEANGSCSSLQFYAWYKKEPHFDAAYANRWNATKRFLKVSIDKDGDLATWMDVATVGKVTYNNFADVIDWWASMTGDLFQFMDAEEAALKKK